MIFYFLFAKGTAPSLESASYGHSDMNAKASRRKKVYLGWKEHGHIIVRFATYWFAYNFMVWQLLDAKAYLKYVVSLSRTDERMTFAEFTLSLLRQNGWIVAFALLFGLIFVWDIVRLTHHIVGPLKNVENLLYRMAAGESVAEVKFRKGDLLGGGFEQAFNAYLASLQKTENAKAVETAAAVCQPAAESPPPQPCCGSTPATSPFADKRIAELLREVHEEAGSPA
jgi:hypothetical protein